MERVNWQLFSGKGPMFNSSWNAMHNLAAVLRVIRQCWFPTGQFVAVVLSST